MNVTGMAYCFNCPAGFYCSGGDSVYKCSKGHYCPENTTTAEPECPPGTYNPVLGKKFSRFCYDSTSESFRKL